MEKDFKTERFVTERFSAFFAKHKPDSEGFIVVDKDDMDSLRVVKALAVLELVERVVALKGDKEVDVTQWFLSPMYDVKVKLI